MVNLHRLAKTGNIDALRRLIDEATDARSLVNQVDEYGFTPLYYAVSSTASIEAVKLLLEAGADMAFVKIDQVPELPENLPGALPGLTSQDLDKLRSILRASPRLKEFRQGLPSAAVRRGDPDIVRLLYDHGADFSYRDENGNTAMLDAVYGSGDRLPIVSYLLQLGLEAEGTTLYGESAIRSAYHLGQFSVVAALIDGGAQDSSLRWTPLIRAVAVGTFSDVEREIALKPDLSARDMWDRTALHVALLKGDRPLVEYLLRHGANLDEAGQLGSSSLAYAVESGNSDLVAWLSQQGSEVDGPDAMGRTCLAVAAETGNHSMVRTLLRLGANPNAEMDYTTVLECAGDRETLLALLEHGANPGDLRHDNRRILLDLGAIEADGPHDVTREQYLAGRFPREGNGNPEERNDPFWLAMIRSGLGAYRARKHFDDPASFVCGVGGARSPAVWCADRLGQSLTILPDSRMVLIAGEHEDSYDPDFCIYNDVFVCSPDGEIRIFTYPYSVFPPTDFHTATLVDDSIFIIGSLGHAEQRTMGAPVYRLNLTDFHIEGVATTGADPGRIYNHRAKLIGADTIIKIEGGTLVTITGDEQEYIPNHSVFHLSLATLTWSRESSL